MSKNTDEIDLIEFIKKIYVKKKLVLITTFVFALTSILYTLSKPNLYTSSTTFIPQLSSSVKPGGSSLSGLASMAGINLSGTGSSSDFPPTLYPNIINSVPFKLDLLLSKIEVNSDSITIRDYFGSSNNFSENLKQFDYTEKNIFSISENDESLFNKVSANLIVELNEKGGFVSISFTDTNKIVAAQIVRISKNLLKKQIVKFKNQSSKEILDFSVKQYNERKLSFESLQDQTAMFIDKNQNISSSLYKNRLNRLESDLEIYRSILLQLASQVEQSKLQLNKNTPVFTTIQPVTIPYHKSGPFRSRTVIIFTLMGFVFSVLYIISKDLIINIIKSIKS